VIYLDAAAGAPLDPEFKSNFRHLLEASDPKDLLGVLFGHSKSLHEGGRRTRDTLMKAEEALLGTLGLSTTSRQKPAYRVQFLPSGSEALERGVEVILTETAQRGEKKGSSSLDPVIWRHGEGEHSALRQFRKRSELHGVSVDHELLTSNGVTSSQYELHSLIYGQNETGIISHIQNRFFQAPESQNQLRLVDLIASWGKVAIPEDLHSGRTLYTVQAGKVGGFPGCGALIYPEQLGAARILKGNQNIHFLAAHSFQFLSERITDIRTTYQSKVKDLRDWFERELERKLPGVHFTHKETPSSPDEAVAGRLPHVSHFRIPNEKPMNLVQKLDLKGFCVSSGSACKSLSPEPSEALLEKGWSRVEALNAIRVSLSPQNTREELELFIETLHEILENERR
jgi:cysteine sulfinate desulfinase/cysteine desulfurase-like protein